MRKKFEEDSTVNSLLDVVFNLIVLDEIDSAMAIIENIKNITNEQLDHREVPIEFSLEQNYPNPFNPTTTIRYELPRSVMVALIIYEILERELLTLVNERQKPGRYVVTCDARKLVRGAISTNCKPGAILWRWKKCCYCGRK